MPGKTKSENDSALGAAAAAISAAVARAEAALDQLKQALGEEELEDLGAKASAAAKALYREGQELLAQSEPLARAKTELTESVRRNPLAAVGLAFAAGLLVALFTRG